MRIKKKNTPQSEGAVPQDTININDNTSTEASKEQNEMETQVQQTNQKSGATYTDELLKETTCALKQLHNVFNGGRNSSKQGCYW